jgi:hypothetical protein
MDENRCEALFKVENGVLVDFTQIKSISHGAYSAEHICKSGRIYRNDIGTYCMPAHVSLSTERRRENGAGELCKFNAFINPLNLDDPKEYFIFSRCGFNKDSAGYCDIHKGDEEFISAYANYQKLFEADLSNCHILATLDKCTETSSNDRSANLLWNQAHFYTNRGSYASVANNDKCVKSAITKLYWQEGLSSFLGNAGYITLSLSLIYTLLMMS